MRLDFEFAVWLAVTFFVILGWSYMATQWGFLDSFEHAGFTMRTILRTRRFIRWDSLDKVVREYRDFLPRLSVRPRDKRFLQLYPSFVILLRRRAVDEAFANEVRSRFAVVQVNNIDDLM